jgi:hypothetical protein
MKITKQQFDELKNASDLEQVLKAVGIEVEDEKFPQECDAYSYVNDGGNIDKSTWTDHRADHFRHSLGKATTFRRWQAEIAIRRWRDEHCPFTPDWANGNQKKWYRVYGHVMKKWLLADTYMVKLPSMVYFATEADVKACAEALPDEWNALLID